MARGKQIWIIGWPAGLMLALALAGCSSAMPTGTGTGNDAAGLRNDSFLPYTEVQTEVLHTSGGAEKTSLALIARRDRQTGAITTHALVGVSYVGRLLRHYDSARNQQAGLLPLHIVRREGASCRSNETCVHIETFRVDIAEPELRAAHAAARGYPLKLYARSGLSTLFPITREQVAALYKATAGWATVPAVPAAAGTSRRP